MIITSLPRSGSTKYCLDKANELGLPFLDEPFELVIDAAHKMSTHEITLPSVTPKTASFLQMVDFDKVVVNNHEINFFLLEKTDLFLSRQNVQDSLWSYIAYADKYATQGFHRPPHDDLLNHLITRYFKRINLFFEFIIIRNKEVVVPNLTFSDSSKYREQYSRFKPRIDSFATQVRLPSGFTFE